MLSVADTDALLYLPDRDLDAPRRAATSPRSARAGRSRSATCSTAAQNRRRRRRIGTEPGWAGFRPLRVDRVVPETSTVASIYLTARTAPRRRRAPGQYLTLRVPTPASPRPVRSYSLSSAPGAGTYRISVKREPHGVVSRYLTTRLRAGAILDVAAPRGDFVLDDGTGPVLLVSAGIGVTPVLAMLHQLAAARSTRDVWWIHAARGPPSTPSPARRTRLLPHCRDAHEHIFYSAATPPSRRRPTPAGPPTPPRSPGSASRPPPPPTSAARPRSWPTCGTRSSPRHRPGPHPHRAVRCAAGDQPRLTDTGRRPRTSRPGPPGTGPLVTFARSGLSCAVRRPAPQPARAGRRLRRPDPLVLPHRRLPHLHHAAAVRRHRLRARPARAARRTRSSSAAPARQRRRARPLSPRPSTVDGGQRRWTPTTRVSAAPRMRPSPAPATTSSGLCAPR